LSEAAGSIIICRQFMRKLPSGTITMLFADVERSTALLQEVGPSRYGTAISDFRRTMRAALTAQGGVEVDTEGDAVFAAFPSARQAVAAAAEAQEGLSRGRLRVRMGLHTGEPLVVDDRYSGIDVHRAARIAAAGHGGQILLSQSTQELLDRSVVVRDLGRHRLKDLGEPTRLYQLGEREFPPPRSLDSTNLPFQPTPLIGRERELRDAGALLRTHRLVTLTGPGGSGKTRLALQLAADAVDRYPDGVIWVPLQSLRDPELVLPTTARALGARAIAVEDMLERRVLLVLDNFEQLLAAAASVGDLGSRLPDLTVLVTSREPLHLRGEQEYPVSPMRETEALTLFFERATAAKPDFDDQGEVPEICRRLDCLPLAIELAAARVKALSAAELLKRLDKRLPMLTGGPRDAPERQRTLRATIAWSYELLTSDEQRLFARLAVFSDGCTLEAAEAVCEADLDAVTALIDKSLLRRDGDRYWMLETIGEYALERLEESNELDDSRRRHAEYYLEQARAVEDLIRSPQAAAAVDRLEQDHGNLRAALRWLSDETPDAPLRLAVWGLAARLHGSGDRALDHRDLSEAARLYRQSLEIAVQLNDETQIAYSLAGLAAVSALRENHVQAARLWASVIRHERESGARLHETERQRYGRVLAELERRPDTAAEFADSEAMRLDTAADSALATVD
jgi:predicted ATPase/class 3 adenylate cyclase